MGAWFGAGWAIRLRSATLYRVIAVMLAATGSPLIGPEFPLIGPEFVAISPLAAAFGLTPAETRVLASLFAGRTLAETAATFGITRPTAKTENPPRTRLPEDRGHAPGRPDASVDGADLPDGIEHVM